MDWRRKKSVRGKEEEHPENKQVPRKQKGISYSLRKGAKILAGEKILPKILVLREPMSDQNVPNS